MVAAPAIAMDSSVITVSAPLAIDLSARSSVISRINPKNPAAASVIHIGKAGERQIWSSEVAQAQFMRDVPSREQRTNGQASTAGRQLPRAHLAKVKLAF